MGQTVNYASKATPDDYICQDCGAKGVRLYREYQTFPPICLTCTACTLKSQRRSKPDSPSAHSIKWRVAAIPTEDGQAFWGFTSVPQMGVFWWDTLPVAET